MRLSSSGVATFVGSSLFALVACSRPSAAVLLDQKLVSPDGLIAVHFPGDFVAKTTSSPAGSSISATAKTATKGTVSFVTKPGLTSSLDGFVKEFHTPGPDEADESRAAATCAGKPGLAIRTTWTVKALPFVKRRCYAIVDGTGFISTYAVLRDEAPANEATLRAIVDATEFLK